MAVNPIGAGLSQERTDQGVDFGGSGPLYALGDGTVVNTTNSGWPNNTFLVIKLNQAINGQSYVYYAEDLTPSVSVGQKVTAGQQIATATGGSSGIEVGWASSNLGQAAAASQFTGSNATSLGQDFENLLASLKGGGTVQGIQGNVPGVSAPGAVPSGAVSPGSDAVSTDSLGTETVLKGAEGLLHGVATMLDYVFGMFGRGQGWRLVFTLVAAGALWMSYRNLAAGGGWV